MKNNLSRALLALVLGIIPSSAFSQLTERILSDAVNPEHNEDDVRDGRDQYDLLRLKDPATGRIPAHMRAKELQFASRVLSDGQSVFAATEPANDFDTVGVI